MIHSTVIIVYIISGLVSGIPIFLLFIFFGDVQTTAHLILIFFNLINITTTTQNVTIQQRQKDII